MNGNRFIVRVGSVGGRAHRSLDQANQDAVYCHSWDGGLAAVVCDGCGSAPHSGMGAALGCRLTAGALIRRQDMLARADCVEDAERYLAVVEADVLTALAALVAGCPGPAERTIHDCLLFTVLGIAISGENALLFGLGDGIFGYNGDIQVLGPYPDNAPPYLGYALLPDGMAGTALPAEAEGGTPRACGNAGDRLRGPAPLPRALDHKCDPVGEIDPVLTPLGARASRSSSWATGTSGTLALPDDFANRIKCEAHPVEGAGDAQARSDVPRSSYCLVCHAFLPTAELRTAVIGTDGVVDALHGAAGPLPGTAEPFGSLAQFWEDDRYARNPDLLRRRLARAARAVPGTPAILADDTSLVVIRRVESEDAP